MQNRIHEVARRITGERASRAVRAVRAWRKPENEDSRVRVAESRHRLSPILDVAIGAPFLARDAFPPRDEPRAAPARRDLAIQFRERGQVTTSITASLKAPPSPIRSSAGRAPRAAC